jgi:hypothetical protein
MPFIRMDYFFSNMKIFLDNVRLDQPIVDDLTRIKSNYSFVRVLYTKFTNVMGSLNLMEKSHKLLELKSLKQ